MSVILITGSAGLIGSEAVRFFANKGFTVVGIDNNMRQVFFGEDASTEWNRQKLSEECGDRYIHYSADIRDRDAMTQIFQDYSSDLHLIVHTAAQPSHDWAAKDPYMDFSVNANGTLVLLESTRQYCPNAVFIFCSTNKVYGDTPNYLPLIEQELRWEIEASHPYYQGIDETMSIDRSKHSLFGASKVAADILVQEYGRYFDLKTASFRGGCLTGPSHSGTQLHGFLSYLMKCTMTGQPYQVFGYKGKQVRDNIHSYDLVNAFYHFYQAPRVAEVYNIGGSRYSNCSMLEAIQSCEAIADKKLNWTYAETNRIGDHIWWISDVKKFTDILKEIYTENVSRWL
jgi:CDP-paratose 2-epimerase